MNRRILLEDPKPEKPVRIKHRQRWCHICERWYRSPNEKAVAAHQASRGHKRAWNKRMYG